MAQAVVSSRCWIGLNHDGQRFALIRVCKDLGRNLSILAYSALQDVAYERRSPSRVRRLISAQVEQVPALQNTQNGNGAPPELDALKGCSSGTISVHGGERAGRPRVSDSLTTPLVQVSSWCLTQQQRS